MDYGHSNFELSVRPILDPNQAGNAVLDTDPSEHSALMTNVDFGFLLLDARSCLLGNTAPGRRPMEGITNPLPVESSGLALAPDSGHVDLNRRYDKLDNSVEPQFGSDSRQSSLESEDAI